MRGMSFSWEEFKNEPIFNHIGQFVIFLVMTDVIFFHMHYLSHQAPFYKYVHKRHHEWVYTTCAATIYASPFENIFVNYLSISGPAIILGSNYYFAMIW